MLRILPLALATSLALPIASCSTKEELSSEIKPVIVKTLLSATESWNGDSYKYPRGKSQITLQRITAQPGFKTPLHSHPQPGIAYVVKGRLSCGTIDGKVLEVGSGESFATPQDTIHFCESVASEAALVFVVSAGIEGQKVTAPYKKK